MTLLTPELLLLALPLAWLLWRTCRVPSWRLALRGLVVLALLAALGGLHGGGAVEGRDLVLVVDRSRSMPAGARRTAAELADLLRQDARPGDRLAVLSFGGDTVIDQALGDLDAFPGFVQEVDPDASHLADALDAALALIPENRPGSILVLSDGEFHGRTPDDVARRAALRGVRVDVRALGESDGTDVAVEALHLPESVGPGERFQFSATVRSDRATSARWRLLRGETVVASGERDLHRGANQLLFRDVAGAAGVATYRLIVEAEGDTVPENDRGLGVTRVDGRRPLLLVNEPGQAGRLAAALRGAGLEVHVAAPGDLPAEGAGLWLESYAGVVLENVAAGRLEGSLLALANQVRDLGLGLLITGGHASYGVGGYYRSALEPVLPVTMELRIEHRKMALAMAVVLDRSGSMSAGVGSGRTKMDLANAGTIEAIKVLGPIDEIAVIAVDSAAHEVVGLRPVDDVGAITSRVSGIVSQGGGIYTYNGLREAADQLEAARAMSRHIILFADAADAEQPGQYKDLLDVLTNDRNTTVSVVALGQETDADGEFLRDVARRGGGEIYFTTSPEELPRLFAQDTLLAARSAFVEQATGSRATGALAALSPTAGAGPWATLPGYNLTYLHPEATAGVVTTDEYAAPLVAIRQAGLGRSAAYTGQVDGQYGVPDGAWSQVADQLVTLARWIVAQEPPARLFPSVRRDGREALVTVEVDREVAGDGADEALTVHLVAPDGSSRELDLPRVAGDRYEARLPLGGEGVYRLAGSTDRGEVLTLPPLAVPYSPEFAARVDPDEGLATLGRLARLGRGRLNPPLHEVLAGDRGGRGLRSWVRPAALAALLLLLGEILWRRWYEGDAEARRRARVAARAATQASERDGPASEGRSGQAAGDGRVGSTPLPTKQAARTRRGGAAGKTTGAAPTPSTGDGSTTSAPSSPPAGQEPPAAPGLDDLLRSTKQKRRR